MIMNTHQRKKISNVIVVFGLVIILAGAVFGTWYYYSHKTSNNSTNSTQTSPKTEFESDKSTAVDPEVPATQTKPTEPNSNIPTPTLVKSAGNNGSAPADVLVDFTCNAPAGYSCQLVLKPASGSNITFEKKNISTDSRGQTFAIWEWKTIKGTWQAQVLLYNSSGQSNSSAPQSFEVK